MAIVTGEATGETIKESWILMNKKHFISKLQCFSDHQGLRPGELCPIVGPTGGSKSTLVKTIITECLEQHKKVYCLLSEENPEDYRLPVWKHFYNLYGSEDKTNFKMQNLLMESERSIKDQNKQVSSFFLRLDTIIFENGVDVVIFDNVSTGFIHNLPFREQNIFAGKAKGLAVKHSIPVIPVIHTVKGTDINKFAINGDSVRGNANFINMGGYNYIISTFFRLDIPRTFLLVDKARNHPNSNKNIYELFYDHDSQIFKKDVKSSYESLTTVMATCRGK